MSSAFMYLWITDQIDLSPSFLSFMGGCMLLLFIGIFAGLSAFGIHWIAKKISDWVSEL